MNKKTLLIAAGFTVAAALAWKAWRNRQKAAGAGIAAASANVRDTVVNKTANGNNLSVDLDPVGL